MTLFFLVLLCIAFASTLVAGQKDFDCNQFNNNCLSCIQYSKRLAFQCSYCPVDGVCHTVGSLFNKCKNEECVSLSSASSCTMRTADDCKKFVYGEK
eukprot:gene38674-47017_t